MLTGYMSVVECYKQWKQLTALTNFIEPVFDSYNVCVTINQHGT